MTGVQIDALTSPMEGAKQYAEEVPQLSSIKIRFKKGAIFAKPGDESTAVDIMAARLLISLSPGSEKKKTAECMGFENDEHVMKRIKAEENSKTRKSTAIDSAGEANKKTSCPASSMPTTTITTSSNKGPAQAASIFRKLAKKLATQPLLLDHLKEYRSSITAQHREDIKTIASLRTKLSTVIKEAAEKELRAAEELKASQEMVQFWTDSCNDEFEGAMLLKEKIHDLIDKVEAMGKADAVGDASDGFGKGLQIEFELQKLGAEMKNMIAEVASRACTSAI